VVWQVWFIGVLIWKPRENPYCSSRSVRASPEAGVFGFDKE
jgi:hypothetical protein